LAVVEMKLQRDQYFNSILACMKMPRGGVQGGGLMHCEFEFIAPSEAIVRFLMEDLPLMRNQRYNLSIAAPHWEDSPSINTYHALDCQLLDAYLRLHRRPAARLYRVYRGSVLLNPPHTHPAPVCLLSVCPPFLVELCHRKHGKLVLATRFNLCILNDQNLLTMSPVIQSAVGMDVVLQARARDHLTKMFSKHLTMSQAFRTLALTHQTAAPESEGEWVPPPPT
jgi:hypothetical protein